MLGFALALIGLAGGLTYVFTRSSGSFGIEFPGVKFHLDAPTQVQVPEKKLASLDSTDYVIDDLLGFAYRRPASPPWSQPVPLHGYRRLLASQQFAIGGLNPALVDAQLARLGRLGQMIRAVETIRITSGRPVTIRTTARSTQSAAGIVAPAGVGSLAFQNAFGVEVYDRSLLHGTPVPLAGLFGSTVTTIGVALGDVDVHDGTILASAVFHYRNVFVAGRPADIDVYHAYLFAQSARRFYVVEILYSPQTHQALRRWDDLQTMLKSFVVR